MLNTNTPEFQAKLAELRRKFQASKRRKGIMETMELCYDQKRDSWGTLEVEGNNGQ